METSSSPLKLKELSQVFLKLGFLSFGGPAVHIAMMRSEFVERRGWLSEKEFMDLLGATNLIPGPNSTELAIFIGHKLGGWRGLILSGTCFILPAFFIVLVIAMLYQRFGGVPDTHSILIGMRPVVVGVVFLALWKLGASVYKTGIASLVILFAAAILIYLGVYELAVIFGAGLFLGLYKTHFTGRFSLSSELFLFFFKVGSVLFGSGYVLLAFLQKDLVEKSKLLTQAQLLDAITIGQVTPGPVFTTASFIGYVIDGFSGAFVSTLGIFLPSFILVAIIIPFISRLRHSTFFSHALDGVNAASLGLMLVVLVQLAVASFINPITCVLGFCSILILYYFQKLNSAYLIICGALIGYFFL